LEKSVIFTNKFTKKSKQITKICIVDFPDFALQKSVLGVASDGL
jgi:hypothetical protein